MVSYSDSMSVKKHFHGNIMTTICSPVFSQTPLYKGMLILKLGLYPDLP